MYDVWVQQLLNHFTILCKLFCFRLLVVPMYWAIFLLLLLLHLLNIYFLFFSNLFRLVLTSHRVIHIHRVIEMYPFPSTKLSHNTQSTCILCCMLHNLFVDFCLSCDKKWGQPHNLQIFSPVLNRLISAFDIFEKAEHQKNVFDSGKKSKSF